MTTRVLNYKRHKPLPAGSVYVGRANRYGCAGVYGNVHTPGPKPCDYCSAKFRIKVTHEGLEALEIYDRELLTKIADEKGFAVGFVTLVDKTLVCGCVEEPWESSMGFAVGKPCHAKIIAGHLAALPPRATPADAVAYARAELARLASNAVEEADTRG